MHQGQLAQQGHPGQHATQSVGRRYELGQLQHTVGLEAKVGKRQAGECSCFTNQTFRLIIG